MFLFESKLGFDECKYNEYRRGKLFQWGDFTDVRKTYGLKEYTKTSWRTHTNLF